MFNQPGKLRQEIESIASISGLVWLCSHQPNVEFLRHGKFHSLICFNSSQKTFTVETAGDNGFTHTGFTKNICNIVNFLGQSTERNFEFNSDEPAWSWLEKDTTWEPHLTAVEEKLKLLWQWDSKPQRPVDNQVFLGFSEDYTWKTNYFLFRASSYPHYNKFSFVRNLNGLIALSESIVGPGVIGHLPHIQALEATSKGGEPLYRAFVSSRSVFEKEELWKYAKEGGTDVVVLAQGTARHVASIVSGWLSRIHRTAINGGLEEFWRERASVFG